MGLDLLRPPTSRLLPGVFLYEEKKHQQKGIGRQKGRAEEGELPLGDVEEHERFAAQFEDRDQGERRDQAPGGQEPSTIVTTL